MLIAIAPTKYRFFHTGKTNKLSFSDTEFIALNISTVTNTDKLIVDARCAISLVNISHPISGNSVEHWWKCVCTRRFHLRSNNLRYQHCHTHQLVIRNLRSARIVNEPPRVSKHSCTADIDPDSQVTKEQPSADKRFPTIPRRHPHDRVVWRVESESGGRQTVCHQVHP